jgi:ribosomal protein S18 acetylase RimI-like enzyme
MTPGATVDDLMEMREFQSSDFDRVRRLWTDCGLRPTLGDELEDLADLLHPQLFVVGVDSGLLVAALLATFDGRRGWLNHLAVDPAYRRRGLATLLVRDVERRLRALGCRKVNLLIEPDNLSVQQFYETLGYGRDGLVFMERRVDGVIE